MNKRPVHPKWWVLYILSGIFMSLFFLEAEAPLTAGLHMWLQIGLLLLMFGGVWLWLEMNGDGFL